MVFYVQPKRRMRERQPQEKISVKDLPDEILLQIFEGLDFPSILRCRQSCSHCVPACNTLIQKRSSRLYISPVPKHLLAAGEICGHPVFSQQINEVIVQASSRIWPIEFPKPRNKALKANDQDEHRPFADPPAFDTAYRSLIDALASLPNLKKLTYAESGEPGLNQVSRAATRSTKPREVYFSDEDVFRGILFSPRLQFDSIWLEEELPGKLKPMSCSQFANQGLRCLSSFSTLDLALDCGWPYNERRALYRRLLILSGPTLKNLRIAFNPNASVKKAGVENTLETFMGAIEFPRLQSLQLELLDPNLPKRRPSSDPPQRTRRQRPSCQNFNILTFLTVHIKTLTHIKFKDVIFTNSAEGAQHGPINVLRSTLHSLKTAPILQPFSWVVGCYKHDRRCKRSDSDWMFDCVKYECGRYHKYWWQSSTVEEFERLAVELDVDYDEDGQVWDFGQCVTESIQQRVATEA